MNLLPQTRQIPVMPFDVIRNVLLHDQGWPKVHAAEYLIWLHHPEGVQEIFKKEWKAHGNEPRYRIGIWRVLGQAAGNEVERDKWLDKIRGRFGKFSTTRSATRRGNAHETPLSTLCRRCKNCEDDCRSFPKRTHGIIFNVFIGFGREAGCRGTVGQLFAISQRPNSLDSGLRDAILAVSLGRHITKTSKSRKMRATRPLPARINVVSALAIHSFPKIDRDWTIELIDCMKHGNDEDKIDAGQALALVGDTSDITQLKPLLNSLNRDFGSTVAYAILRIGQR